MKVEKKRKRKWSEKDEKTRSRGKKWTANEIKQHMPTRSERWK